MKPALPYYFVKIHVFLIITSITSYFQFIDQVIENNYQLQIRFFSLHVFTMDVGSGDLLGFLYMVQTWASAAENRGAVAPLGFSSFFRCPPRKRLNSAIFWSFLLFFGLLFHWPPWKFFCRRPWVQI